MHLLVIEDERALCETIVRSLRRLAYSVDYCYDGEKALALLGVERYDLVLLDLNLPKKDGMTVLRTLRQTDRETRVLILSARGEVEDKVEGLDAGANDYLAKPFHLAELEARIRSLTLRQFTQQDVLLSCGALTFDTRSRTAVVNGQTLTLTRKETGILEYLMVHQGRPVSQEELMDHVWDNSVDSFSNSIRAPSVSLVAPAWRIRPSSTAYFTHKSPKCTTTNALFSVDAHAAVCYYYNDLMEKLRPDSAEN